MTRRTSVAMAELPPRRRWRAWSIISRFVYRRAFATWGANSVMVRPLRLRGVRKIEVGDDCAIYEGAWLLCEGPAARLRIGSRVYIGHGCSLHSVSSVSIGNDCRLADHVLIDDSSADFRDGSWRVSAKGPIDIGERVFVGERACILGSVTVGDDAVIGANAVVTHDVGAGQTVAGAPARPVGGP